MYPDERTLLYSSFNSILKNHLSYEFIAYCVHFDFVTSIAPFYFIIVVKATYLMFQCGPVVTY